MQKLKMSLGAVGLLCCAAATASAAPFLSVDILGSTSQSGPFTSSLSASAGSTIYYELTLVSAPAGTTNTNASGKSPNGTTDTVNSLGTFDITDPNGKFLTANYNSSTFAGTGGNATIQSGLMLESVRAVAAAGVFVNDDTSSQPLIAVSGTFQLSQSGSAEAITGYYGNLAGSTNGTFKVAGSLVAETSASETSADPYVAYQPLEINAAAAPEPSSLMLLSGAVFGLLARRRRGSVRSA